VRITSRLGSFRAARSARVSVHFRAGCDGGLLQLARVCACLLRTHFHRSGGTISSFFADCAAAAARQTRRGFCNARRIPLARRMPGGGWYSGMVYMCQAVAFR